MYSSPTHMYNVDLFANDALEFPDLPHRRPGHTSSSLDSGELEVGKKFSNKIVKQKELEKMHCGWDASYNEMCQWCQVLERYVLGCVINLETVPTCYNDYLLRGYQAFKHLFGSFKQCRDTFQYYKPLVQIDGTFIYGRYTHRLLLVVAQDGDGRILPIVFTITPGSQMTIEIFFLSRLRNVYPQPDICIILDRSTQILVAIERQGSL
ncbi:hypothetical protein PVK06_002421 [Gossypium arboreum]|uniref:MULE transposase domain-containing protein n=1 Tax=Gossypium arboreum TaxID=29729 RepID=A0ABR0R3J8_GOSAR|nr:hypothetical protein PVK06_002421 [Gossypium arboreum]